MAQVSEQRGSNAVKPVKGEKSRFRDQSVTITLSMPKALFGLLFSLFVLVWVFIFGIMLGRGHNPEEVVPELAKVMPAPPAALPVPAPADELLHKRDLKYHDSLKGKNAAQPPRVTAPASAPQAGQQSGQPQARQQPDLASKPATPKPAATPKRAQPPQPAAPDQDQTVYNYVYQVAAFNQLQQAQSLQQKLQRGGMTVKVTETQANNRTWFRILVNFKGKTEDTRKLREKLAEHGIQNIILRDKVPAT